MIKDYHSTSGVVIGSSLPDDVGTSPDVVTTSHTANFSSSATGFVYISFTMFHLQGTNSTSINKLNNYDKYVSGCFN